jgi:hypothetical protein
MCLYFSTAMLYVFVWVTFNLIREFHTSTLLIDLRIILEKGIPHCSRIL